jgi:Skp family chaperone for outer membrane proteins
MKKLILVSAICSSFAITAFAQTPAPPPRSTAASSAPAGSAPSGGTGAEGKIAYLNIGLFGQGIIEYKVKLDALNAEFEPKIKEMKGEEEALSALKSKIQNQGATVSPQVRAQWQDELSQKEKALKRKLEDYNAEGNRKLAVVSQPILDKIMDFLRQYCQQRGIVLVIDGGKAYEAGIMIWGAQAADITADFMNEYNKANPSGSAPAAPAPKKP